MCLARRMKEVGNENEINAGEDEYIYLQAIAHRSYGTRSSISQMTKETMVNNLVTSNRKKTSLFTQT